MGESVWEICPSRQFQSGRGKRDTSVKKTKKGRSDEIEEKAYD